MKHKRLNGFVSSLVIFLSSTILLSGCSQAFYQPTSFATDDMYSTHDRDDIIKQEQAEAQAEAQLQEQRKAYWAEELGMTEQPQIEQNELYSTPYSEKLARLNTTSEYTRPSSYYALQYDETLDVLAQYDPSEYNAYVDKSGVVVVEPKYRSSMYGVWGTPYVNYAWTYGYPVWAHPRYSWWGYDYNFAYGFGYFPSYYDPWWGYPYPYPYYGFGYHWHRPVARPPHHGGGGGGRPSSIVRRPNITTSPSSSVGRRNVDGSNVGRSTGKVYNRGGSTRNTTTTPSYTAPTRTPSISIPSSRPTPSRSTNRIGR